MRHNKGMKNDQATAKARWAQASQEATDFYKEHYGSWTFEVDNMYRQLQDFADKLYYAWVAEATGKTTQEVAYSVNEAIHSRFD
jgi:hypothetical protein